MDRVSFRRIQLAPPFELMTTYPNPAMAPIFFEGRRISNVLLSVIREIFIGSARRKNVECGRTVCPEPTIYRFATGGFSLGRNTHCRSETSVLKSIHSRLRSGMAPALTTISKVSTKVLGIRSGTSLKPIERSLRLCLVLQGLKSSVDRCESLLTSGA
jgi:hypothetical protein